MANVALTYGNQGRWDKAEKLQVDVMNARMRVLGREHHDTLSAMADLATTYRAQRQSVKAEELEAKAEEIRSQLVW